MDILGSLSKKFNDINQVYLDLSNLYGHTDVIDSCLIELDYIKKVYYKELTEQYKGCQGLDGLTQENVPIGIHLLLNKDN